MMAQMPNNNRNQQQTDLRTFQDQRGAAEILSAIDIPIGNTIPVLFRDTPARADLLSRPVPNPFPECPVRMGEKPPASASAIKQASHNNTSRSAKLGKNFMPRGRDFFAERRRHSLALNQK